jgi:hypothetical protein
MKAVKALVAQSKKDPLNKAEIESALTKIKKKHAFSLNVERSPTP